MSPALPGFHRASAAAAFVTVLLLQTSPVRADEIAITNCLHGTRNAYDFGYSHDYGSEYSSGEGGSYSFSRGFSVPLRGFGRGFRRAGSPGQFIDRARSGVGGAQGSGSHANANSGYDDGYATGYGGGSSREDSSDSCVEIRRALTNPYVIQVQQAQSPEETRAAEERDRLWRDRCHPVVKQDVHGVPRYAYSAPGCEYGRYE